jgi:hypothetical protein
MTASLPRDPIDEILDPERFAPTRLRLLDDAVLLDMRKKHAVSIGRHRQGGPWRHLVPKYEQELANIDTILQERGLATPNN